MRSYFPKRTYMAFQVIRLALAFTVAGCALCQERPDPVAYAYFFSQVATLNGADQSSPDSANGDGIARTVPKIRDVIGLSGAEVEILNKIAADCVAATDSLQEPRRQLIFDSRLEYRDWQTLGNARKKAERSRRAE